jgi:hypothetical protein
MSGMGKDGPHSLLYLSPVCDSVRLGTVMKVKLLICVLSRTSSLDVAF